MISQIKVKEGLDVYMTSCCPSKAIKVSSWHLPDPLSPPVSPFCDFAADPLASCRQCMAAGER